MSKLHLKRRSSLDPKPENAVKADSNEIAKTYLGLRQKTCDMRSAYQKAKDFLQKNGITVSTITLNCRLGSLVNDTHFAKYVVLQPDGIVSIKFGKRKDTASNRSIVKVKTKKKPSKKGFYNQVTILMQPTNQPDRNFINIKVFKNGALQITGCKDMEDFTNVVNRLIKILKQGVDIKRHNKIRHYDFLKSPSKVGIYDVKIRMINSNFKVNYKIDRKKLDSILTEKHGVHTRDKEIGYVEHKYKPTGGHSCVNIKYQYDQQSKPSIFVFQTGAIIITGAKTLDHIIGAYHFINKILNQYFYQIRIVDLRPKQVNAEIDKFIRNRPQDGLLDGAVDNYFCHKKLAAIKSLD